MKHLRWMVLFPALLLGAAMLHLLEQRMIFPAPLLPDSWLSLQADKQGAQELRIVTEDGVQLYGWHLRTQNVRRGVVLWFEGNGGTVGARPYEFRALMEEGWDVVQINYRGYPGSEGTPSETGLRRDARAAWEYAEKVDPRIWIIGKSLGGGVAVGLAAERPAALLLIESSFTSVAAVASHLSFFAVGYLVVNRFDSMALAPQVKAPTLVLHGAADPLIPIEQGRQLAGALQAEFISVPGKGHNESLMLLYWEEVRRWMSTHSGSGEE